MRPEPFKKDVRKTTWAKAPEVEGRFWRRWKRDAVGTPVMKKLYGLDGLCGWVFDHKEPDGGAGVENCQILNTKTNNRNSDEKNLSSKDLLGCSNDIQLNEHQLDFAEMVVYGNLKDEFGLDKCQIISQLQAAAENKTKYKPCTIYECPKEVFCGQEPMQTNCPKQTLSCEAIRRFLLSTSKPSTKVATEKTSE